MSRLTDTVDVLKQIERRRRAVLDAKRILIDSDDFTKADGALPAGWVSFGGTHGVESNQARVLSASFTPAFAVRDAGHADVLVEVDLTNFPSPSVAASTYLILRAIDLDNFIAVGLITSTWQLVLRKRVGGGSLQTVDSVTVPAQSPGVKMWIKGDGTTVTAGLGATQYVGGTITEHATATKHGFGGSSGTVAVNSNRWDNYRVYSV